MIVFSIWPGFIFIFDVFMAKPEKRKEEVKYIDVDPVACAALIWENNFIDHRYQLKYKKNSSPNLWETDEFIDVKHLVGKSHRDQGQKIREYFGNKIPNFKEIKTFPYSGLELTPVDES